MDLFDWGEILELLLALFYPRVLGHALECVFTVLYHFEVVIGGMGVAGGSIFGTIPLYDAYLLYMVD